MSGSEKKSTVSKDDKDTIASFTDLNMWREAHQLAIKINTNLLPNKDQSYLINYLHKNSIDITTNMANSFYKKSLQEKINLYYTAQDSLTTLYNALMLAKDLNIITKKIFDETVSQIILVRKLTFGLIKKFKTLKSNNGNGAEN